MVRETQLMEKGGSHNGYIKFIKNRSHRSLDSWIILSFLFRKFHFVANAFFLSVLCTYHVHTTFDVVNKYIL